MSVFRFLSRGPSVLLGICGLLSASWWPGELSATTVIPPSFEELVSESDYVVRGRVTDVTSDWEQRGKSRVIVSHVTVEVLEVVTGTPPEPLVLTMLGGTVDGQTMRLEGAPSFEVGDEDILFVRGNGRLVSPLTRIMHGRYRVQHDEATGRDYVARENGTPLAATSEVATSLHAESHADDHEGHAHVEEPMALRVQRALSPDEFVRQIRAVKTTTTIKTKQDD